MMTTGRRGETAVADLDILDHTADQHRRRGGAATELEAVDDQVVATVDQLQNARLGPQSGLARLGTSNQNLLVRLLAGDRVSGVSVMRIEREMDAGPVALHRELAIGPEENAGELSERIAVPRDDGPPGTREP